MCQDFTFNFTLSWKIPDQFCTPFDSNHVFFQINTQNHFSENFYSKYVDYSDSEEDIQEQLLQFGPGISTEILDPSVNQWVEGILIISPSVIRKFSISLF